MATQITASLPTLTFPKEVDYPTQEDWAAFSAAAELNFGILGGSWSTQMQLWKTEANAMSIELNTNSIIAQGLANYQGDWVSQGYSLGQTVSVSGIYYICKLTHATGQNPTDMGSLYWNLAIGNWNLKVNTDMSGYTSKATPTDADLLPLSDSVASFGIKKLSWANLKNSLFNSGISTPNINYKSTPITITSWSYVGTTITLNVASHSFIAGNYIEVSGLTATTYPANGVQLVTSVTATTIVFTLGATPTGAAGVSGATVKGYATVNGRVNDYISTLVDVRLNRLINSMYYNTSGKTKWIMASLSSAAVPANLKAIVNGVDVTYGGGTVRTSGDVVSIIFPVPNGLSYQIAGIGGTWTNLTWTETI